MYTYKSHSRANQHFTDHVTLRADGSRTILTCIRNYRYYLSYNLPHTVEPNAWYPLRIRKPSCILPTNNDILTRWVKCIFKEFPFTVLTRIPLYVLRNIMRMTSCIQEAKYMPACVCLCAPTHVCVQYILP